MHAKQKAEAEKYAPYTQSLQLPYIPTPVAFAITMEMPMIEFKGWG